MALAAPVYSQSMKLAAPVYSQDAEHFTLAEGCAWDLSTDKDAGVAADASEEGSTVASQLASQEEDEDYEDDSSPKNSSDAPKETEEHLQKDYELDANLPLRLEDFGESGYRGASWADMLEREEEADGVQQPSNRRKSSRDIGEMSWSDAERAAWNACAAYSGWAIVPCWVFNECEGWTQTGQAIVPATNYGAPYDLTLPTSSEFEPEDNFYRDAVDTNGELPRFVGTAYAHEAALAQALQNARTMTWPPSTSGSPSA